MQDISKNNADLLGLDTMLLQTIEECGELIQSISKYNRTRGIGQKTETSQAMAINSLVEELADVSICVEQLGYLLKIENDVEKMKNIKYLKVAKRYNTNIN